MVLDQFGEDLGNSVGAVVVQPQLATKYHAAAGSLLPPRWDGEENGKKEVKLVGWDNDSLIEEQRKRKIITIILVKEYTK